jgi:shikimate 5-dehydrogenase
MRWGSKAFGLLASLIMAPTVLLPDLAALSILGAGGVAAAALVGLVVSDDLACHILSRQYTLQYN